MLKNDKEEHEDCISTLTKEILVEKFKDRLTLSHKNAREIFEAIIEEIKCSLEKEEVKISGFGKWSIRKKFSRPGRNPYTGEAIEIKARHVVTFYPSTKLKELIQIAKKLDTKNLNQTKRLQKSKRPKNTASNLMLIQ